MFLEYFPIPSDMGRLTSFVKKLKNKLHFHLQLKAILYSAPLQ